jgi:uncharacterized protein (TIGR02231 family)
MKKIIILIVCLWAVHVNANGIKTKIKSVNVSLNGAQVFREGKLTYAKGVSKILLEGVSPQILSDGLTASAYGNFKILDVKHKIKYPEPLQIKPTEVPRHIILELEQLHDSLLYQKLREENYRMKIQTLNEKRNIIKNNKLMLGQGRSDTMPVLKELVSFYQKELFEIDDLLYQWKIKHLLIKNRINKTQIRQRELTQYKGNTDGNIEQKPITHQIEVTIYAKTPGSGTVEVSYLVNNAGWYPAYDIRVIETNLPLELTYKGYVYQRTGEDWENVKLTLVTYDSRLDSKKPELSAWFLKYYVAPQSTSINKAKRMDYSLSNLAIPTMESTSLVYKSFDKNEDIEESKSDPIVNTKIESLANYSFKIELPYTIRSNDEEALLVINDYKVEANYTHYLVPKLNTSAYLVAEISDWEELSLLNAKTNLYLNKTYLGNTNLNTSTLNDTLIVSLGVDRSIFCSRKKVQDHKKCRIIGGKKSQEITIEIEVKNNKNATVQMILDDQIPITMIPEEIEIELVDKDGASHELSSGKLTWNFKLKPQERKKIRFTYSIKYNKGKTLI